MRNIIQKLQHNCVITTIAVQTYVLTRIEYITNTLTYLLLRQRTHISINGKNNNIPNKGNYRKEKMLNIRKALITQLKTYE